VKVIQNDNPTDQEIEKVLDLYIETLRKLFDEHKYEFGLSKKELVVI
jgi:hypothetical protein